MSQGNTEREAVHNFGLMLVMEIALGIKNKKYEDPLEGIPQAPLQYWDLFAKSQRRCNYRIPQHARKASKSPLPKIEPRVAAVA